MRTMNLRMLVPITAAGVVAAMLPAYAVSDGGYDWSKQGCRSNADNSDHPRRVEAHCYSVTVTISDATHRYLVVGVPQTADGTPANAVELCLDLTGTPQCAHVDKNGYRPWTGGPTGAPNPRSADLRAYFGMDDNVDVGEHDSSEYVDNGPSDGGSIHADVAPLTAVQWLRRVQARDGRLYLLTHPLPVADSGVGFCADGLCISAQSQRRVAYRGSSRRARPRDVSNYQGHRWDPEPCSGPTDEKGAGQCGSHSLKWWNQQNGTTYVEPGIQVYEDPDPQGSPAGPYPLPAVYVGTCGLVAGGGAAPAPRSPFTNSAHQLVVSTGC